MLQIGMRGLLWAIAQSGAVAVALAIGLANGAIGQIVPDDTLGAERSRITPLDAQGFPGDVIDGGATRGQNLFHSFRELNVSEERSAYFLNPSNNIRNILARVTGNNRSEILGTLGVLNNTGVTSNPNLFLMNPNGIVFGQNGRLDVGGSFVGTTANAIGFGDRGWFSATSPETPSPLLTISPSVFLFNQVPAAITNSSRNRESGRDPSDSFNPYGLRVPNGQSLLLLGGDINIDNGGLVAFGGQIELGSLGGAGAVGVSLNGDRFNLDFPDNVLRGNVAITNDSGLIVAAGGGGEIGITARNIDILQGSSIQAGILGGLGSPTAQAGDITIDSTGVTTIEDAGSQIYNEIFQDGTGIGGNISIQAEQLRVLDG